MANIVIQTRQDWGRVARYLTEHPQLKYHTAAGDGGTVIVIFD